MVKQNKKNINILIIQILALVLIALGFLIGMGPAMSRQMEGETSELFRLAFKIYENLVRATIVILGVFFTIRYTLQKKGKVSRFRLTSLISFSTMAFIVLILLPLITHFWDFYFALTPFPWLTLPFQLLSKGSFFFNSFEEPYGMHGATIILYGYFGYQLFMFTGVLLLGRRWQCSMICLINGCHAESMGIALPLTPHNKRRPHSKQIKSSVKNVLLIIQLFLFSFNMLLILLWSLFTFFGIALLPMKLAIVVELIKYLSLEVILFMILWIFIGGRGYCYYCPVGFLLGMIGRGVGQRIETDLTHCTGCNACNDACKMSIDVASSAKNNKPVETIQCTGCGLCVDACPTQNLRYTTRFMDWLRSKRGKWDASISGVSSQH